MGTPVPKPAPRQPRPHKGLKRTQMRRGDKPLKPTVLKQPRRIKHPVPPSIIKAVKTRDADTFGIVRCQWPGCNAPAEGEPHHIDARSIFGAKALDERDDPDNQACMCPEHNGACRSKPGANKVMRQVRRLHLLGEEHRTQRDALARERGLI